MPFCRYAKFFVVTMLTIVVAAGAAQIINFVDLDEIAFGGYLFALIIGLFFASLLFFLVCSATNRLNWKNEFP
ncbi:MAG: hypothetical protein NWF05_01410 [Candidatus Bathyarchaeota archaeon]|nr:hypothetical protein [Candidatus Bathyarchaeota archaeon]